MKQRLRIIQNPHSMIEGKPSLFSTDLLVGSFCIFVVSLLPAMPAYAYLDAGTFSILFQSLLGGIAVATTSLYLFWHKIRNFLFGDRNREKSEEDPKDQEIE